MGSGFVHARDWEWYSKSPLQLVSIPLWGKGLQQSMFFPSLKMHAQLRSLSPLQSFGKWPSTPLGNGDEGESGIEGFDEKLYIRWFGGANSQVGL